MSAADHYFHSLTFALLAAQRVGLSKEYEERYREPVKVITDFDPRDYDVAQPVGF